METTSLGPIVRAVSLIRRGLSVAADWADISYPQNKRKHLKPRCTPFPGNMSFNLKNIAKHWASEVSELECAPDQYK